jgi:hypothetical protein
MARRLWDILAFHTEHTIKALESAYKHTLNLFFVISEFGTELATYFGI